MGRGAKGKSPGRAVKDGGKGSFSLENERDFSENKGVDYVRAAGR
jgi:hypothetical protein